MNDHPFGYIVLRDDDERFTRHCTVDSAQKEARRLTMLEQHDFCVMLPLVFFKATFGEPVFSPPEHMRPKGHR